MGLRVKWLLFLMPPEGVQTLAISLTLDKEGGGANLNE